MTHSKKHHADHAASAHSSDKPSLHKDWRTWTVVGLMLIAMLTYILSMDEEIEPGGMEQPQVPAAP